MKYLSYMLFGFLAFSLLFGANLAGAQTAATTTSASAEAQVNLEAELPKVRVNPVSVWYRVKLAWERVVDVFVSGEAQIRRHLLLTKKRLAEARASVNTRAEAQISAVVERSRRRSEAALELYESIKVRLDSEARARVLAELNATARVQAEVIAEIYGEVSAETRAGLDALIDVSNRSLQRLENSTEELKMELRSDDSAEAEIKARLEAFPVIEFREGSTSEIDSTQESDRTEEES
ncbi:MAG TPA: hypothetical protein VGA49_01705, partial [Patescibacteria group bacterium]